MRTRKCRRRPKNIWPGIAAYSSTDIKIRRALPERCGCAACRWRLLQSILSVENIAANVGPLLDGRTGQSSRDLISVSVAAAECMVADALTKIVFALREKSRGFAGAVSGGCIVA